MRKVGDWQYVCRRPIRRYVVSNHKRYASQERSGWLAWAESKVKWDRLNLDTATLDVV